MVLTNQQKVDMDLQATKLGVSKASLLGKVDEILEDEMIVGYSGEGEPLTKELYNKRLQMAEQQIASGEYLTQDDLEKESENW